MPQVEHANAAPRDLVLVRRPDSPTRRSDLLARGALPIEQLVVRQDEMGAITDVETPLDVDAVGDEPIHFGKQRVGVQHDAVADRAPDTRVKNAAGNLTQHELGIADVDRMAGVRAALIPNDPVRPLSEDVDQLALALVPPLCADYDDGALLRIEHESPRNGVAAGKRRLQSAQKNAPARAGR